MHADQKLSSSHSPISTSLKMPKRRPTFGYIAEYWEEIENNFTVDKRYLARFNLSLNKEEFLEKIVSLGWCKGPEA